MKIVCSYLIRMSESTTYESNLRVKSNTKESIPCVSQARGMKTHLKLPTKMKIFIVKVQLSSLLLMNNSSR